MYQRRCRQRSGCRHQHCPHRPASVQPADDFCKQTHPAVLGIGFKAEGGGVGLAVHILAKLITEGLERAGADPSRPSRVQALESIRDLDVGGWVLQVDRRDHPASDFVELTFLDSQSWEP